MTRALLVKFMAMLALLLGRGHPKGPGTSVRLHLQVPQEGAEPLVDMVGLIGRQLRVFRRPIAIVDIKTWLATTDTKDRIESPI